MTDQTKPATAAMTLEKVARMAHEAMQEGSRRTAKQRWDDLRAIYHFAADAMLALRAQASPADGWEVSDKAKAYQQFVGRLEPGFSGCDPEFIFDAGWNAATPPEHADAEPVAPAAVDAALLEKLVDHQVVHFITADHDKGRNITACGMDLVYPMRGNAWRVRDITCAECDRFICNAAHAAIRAKEPTP